MAFKKRGGKGKIIATGGAIGVVSMWLVAFLLGYFENSAGVSGGLSMVLAVIILSGFALLGLVPFVGAFIYIGIGWFFVLPALAEFTGVQSEIILIFFILYGAVAVAFTIVTTLALFKK